MAEAGMAVGCGSIDGPQDKNLRLSRILAHRLPLRAITPRQPASLDQWVTMAGAGLDPVSAPIAGDEKALPGWRGRALGRLAVGADDADEAKAPPCSWVERLGVVRHGHGGCAAACPA
jgi:hypothetical protein